MTLPILDNLFFLVSFIQWMFERSNWPIWLDVVAVSEGSSSHRYTLQWIPLAWHFNTVKCDLLWASARQHPECTFHAKPSFLLRSSLFFFHKKKCKNSHRNVNTFALKPSRLVLFLVNSMQLKVDWVYFNFSFFVFHFDTKIQDAVGCSCIQFCLWLMAVVNQHFMYRMLKSTYRYAFFSSTFAMRFPYVSSFHWNRSHIKYVQWYALTSSNS